jgi:hypothetical protein
MLPSVIGSPGEDRDRFAGAVSGIDEVPGRIHFEVDRGRATGRHPAALFLGLLLLQLDYSVRANRSKIIK